MGNTMCIFISEAHIERYFETAEELVRLFSGGGCESDFLHQNAQPSCRLDLAETFHLICQRFLGIIIPADIKTLMIRR